MDPAQGSLAPLLALTSSLPLEKFEGPCHLSGSSHQQ